jgi:hypothetical protein
LNIYDWLIQLAKFSSVGDCGWLVCAGNIFSSLEGLVFEWSLVSDNLTGEVVDAHNILR